MKVQVYISLFVWKGTGLGGHFLKAMLCCCLCCCCCNRSLLVCVFVKSLTPRILFFFSFKRLFCIQIKSNLNHTTQKINKQNKKKHNTAIINIISNMVFMLCDGSINISWYCCINCLPSNH